ncbi:hypothetical protein PISL3812_08401 [Talaromyces islandicus]|uniref:AB hydrolase-1 domain-containing protein n=1 Tax=Talaromyces islandicus TaxID=28573 RepID=A0A0U1M6V2_TALIS|nr:hypothetical protein PISL3812_08401 [Talaromyces islandicus]
MMQPFRFPLADETIVTGIYNIPPRSSSPLEYRPLIVALHGSTYDCHYFDASSTHTASIGSSAFGIPFISIDRPCYGGTTPLMLTLKESNFPKETGVRLHQFILPSLWSTYGAPNECNCVVLLCHSLGSMGGIFAAALHGRDKNLSYPLGGVIFSGLGDQLLPEMKENPVREPNISSDHVLFPLDVKDSLMFRPGTVNPDILQQSARLNVPTPLAEIESMRDVWLPNWKSEWASDVKVPVMFGLSENDCFFEGTQSHVQRCAAAFLYSSRVDSSLITKAPHCIELSYWSQGWYSRCFGFAMECSADVNAHLS